MPSIEYSTSLRNPPLPQLEYTSYHSWAALIIGRWSGMPFAASTSTELSIHIQPARAEDGRGQLSSNTGSLVVPNVAPSSTALYIYIHVKQANIEKLLL
jgi:hypothetical protein